MTITIGSMLTDMGGLDMGVVSQQAAYAPTMLGAM